MQHVFISYADSNKDIIENLRGRLREYGIDAWVYSVDSTLGKITWEEIEEKIKNSRVAIFSFSKYSEKAEGQKRELEFAIEGIKRGIAKYKIFPMVIGNADYSIIPSELKRINGLNLDACNVKSTAFKIAKILFPEKLSDVSNSWRFPKPGEWLEVCNLDVFLEQYFGLGDKVYFRRISPMGLFECYSHKIKGLFWFAPQNLKPSLIIDEDGYIEKEQVSERYRISTMIEIEDRGLRELEKDGRIPLPSS